RRRVAGARPSRHHPAGAGVGAAHRGPAQPGGARHVGWPAMPERDDVAREAWLLMSEFVYGNNRRRAGADALRMRFARSRALRRLARRPMSMRELADALGIDPPNATVVV